MSSPSPAPGFDRAADAYRRRIRVTTVAPGVVRSELEDDFHHFVVTLRHRDGLVTEVGCESRRWPWATCPGAAAALAGLAGMPLARRFTAPGRFTDPKLACTHQFDAACHAVTHAARGGRRRQYDVEVPVREPATGAARVRLWVDGALALEWSLTWDGIADPEPPYDAAPWRGGFMRWADATLPEDEAECAIVLRRACDIGLGRTMDLDSVPVATALPAVMTGVCHTMRPGVIEHAVRNVGSIRDFAAEPERLLAAD
ncbi:MAG: hypothetical protein KatS3mg009_2660 [Acidimicrobiia bacterium]|nr:MAG: hypothetical protein KatS3mg009_2660 [Acidimicrobiia bacterium]